MIVARLIREFTTMKAKDTSLLTFMRNAIELHTHLPAHLQLAAGAVRAVVGVLPKVIL